MEDQSIFEKNQIKAKEIFEQATFQEFFGNHLFETREQEYYIFTPGESGNAVWLNPSLEPMQVDEARKLSQQVIPSVHTFNHCQPIDRTLFEDRRFSDIEARIRDGGKLLAEKANKAFIDVLKAAISDTNTIRATGQRLDEVLAEVFSLQVNAGFRPDRFIFPQHLEAKLVQTEIINRDKEISGIHYVGHTASGQKPFWSENLSNGTILMFDSKGCIALTKKARFDTLNQLQPFTAGVCGYLSLNPIIKNIQNVFAITHVDEILPKGTAKVHTKMEITFVDINRIKELQALHNTNFDLSKLVRLCEELNSSYASESYLAVTMLTRAILDHVPPIFGYKTFVEVANNYGGKSIKKSLQNLQNSSRNISDSYLHEPIRNKESLPNRTQVDFSNDMDVLLAEIIRILK